MSYSQKAHILRENLNTLKRYHLPSYMSTVSTVRMCSSTNFEPILLCRPHPSMQVNSSCSNSPLQWRRLLEHRIYHQTMQRTDLISRFARGLVACGLLSRPLETCGALRCSFENASLWPPLFVHMALQF